MFEEKESEKPPMNDQEYKDSMSDAIKQSIARVNNLYEGIHRAFGSFKGTRCAFCTVSSDAGTLCVECPITKECHGGGRTSTMALSLAIHSAENILENMLDRLEDLREELTNGSGTEG